MVDGLERRSVWWTAVDYAEFKNACHKLVDDTRSASLGAVSEQQEEGGLCCPSLRGLENWSGKEKQQRRDRIKKAVWLVLDEQESNREDGITDGFAVADMYHQYTASMCMQAQVRGAQDEEAVVWELMEGKEENDNDEIDKPSGIKRRRSSGDKRSSLSSIGTSFKSFARRIGATSS